MGILIDFVLDLGFLDVVFFIGRDITVIGDIAVAVEVVILVKLVLHSFIRETDLAAVLQTVEQVLVKAMVFK